METSFLNMVKYEYSISETSLFIQLMQDFNDMPTLYIECEDASLYVFLESKLYLIKKSRDGKIRLKNVAFGQKGMFWKNIQVSK